MNEIIKQTSPLPFDPSSQVRDSMVIKLTPAMARYILKHHNNDNRKICPSQVIKIAQSVATFGWLFTGDAVIFNTNGDINESQHRLTFIASQDTGEYETSVTLGAQPDSFSNAAIAKPRRPHDEIYRKDNTAEASQTAILGDLLVRKGGKPKLTINNAVKKWFDWKDDIKKAEKICNSFLTDTNDFSTQTKTIGAFVTLCVNAKLGNEAEAFLDLLKAELLGDSTCRLTADFVEYWKEHTWNESNEGKLKVLYMLLCVAMDRILKKPDGSIALNITPSKLDPKTLTGCYRKFIS
jgi:hypothetical protein|tara:strand:- start:613 stop:1494 length:882 start_codon:yes stop_codon:yes gene_type:complete